MPQGPFAPTLLPRLHSSWPHPTPPGVETASVFTLCRSLRWLPARREVSRVQRVPLDACHPCNPGGARRCIRHHASRRVLSSPVRERLDLLGASRGYMRVHFCYGPRPRSSRASAGTSRFLVRRRGATCVDDFSHGECPSFRWDHFAFHGAPPTPNAEVPS